MKNFVSYIRVSTKKQGISMLGLESQRKICNDFVKSHGGEIVSEFKDVESGTHRDRKGLASAVAFCKANNCALVIAKLDRLARDVEFCFKIVNTGIEIHFCDMPSVNTLLLGVFASVAQYERELTSDRTRKALAAKKARGEALGAKTLKWREAYNNKTCEQIKKEHKKSGRTKNERYLQNKETQTFIRVLKNVFPDACKDEDMTLWNWSKINTKGENKDKALSLIKDYKELDENGTIFSKWDFENTDRTKLQVKLAIQINSLRRSVYSFNSK